MTKFLLFLCFALMAGFSVSASIGPPTFNIRTEITKVAPYQMLEFEGVGRARLWGIIPISGFDAFVKDHLLNEVIRCEPAGETYTEEMKSFDDVVMALVCVATSEQRVFRGFLQAHLIASGVAVEYCSETRNYFGTCDIARD